MSTYADIVLKRGTSFSMSITLEDGQQSVVDLTLFTFAAQMRGSYSSEVVQEFTCAVDDPLTGVVTISLSPLQTSTIPTGRYVWDIVALHPTGDVTPIAEGQVEVMPTVTNYYVSSNPEVIARSMTIGKTITGTSILDGQPASYYLDYNNFTNTPDSILDFNITDGLNGQVLTANGDGTFTFKTLATTNATTFAGQPASYYLNYNNLQNAPQSIFDLNVTDGTAGQLLMTNGDGTVTFVDAATVGGNVGDALTLNGQSPSYYLNYANLTNKPTSLLSFGLVDGGVGDVLHTDGAGNFYFSPETTDATTLNSLPASYYLNYANLLNKPTIPTSIFQLDVVDGVAGGVLTTDGAGNATFQLPSTDAMTLAGQPASYYLDYVNFVNKPTIPTSITQLGVTSNGVAGQHLRSNGDGTFSWVHPSTNATTLAGRPDSYYRNYNNLLNKPTIPTSLLQMTDVAGDGLSGYVLTTDGNGNFSFQPAAAGGGTNDYNFLINKPTIPTSLFDLGITDSVAGYVLTTDGSGNATFQPVDDNVGLLNGYNGAYYLNYQNFTNKPVIPTSILDLDVVSDGAHGQFLMTDGNGGFTFQSITESYNALKLDGKDPSYYLNYLNLGNLPTIPTDVSQLTDANNLLANSITDVNQLADSNNLLWRPTDVSQLTDANGLLVHFSGNYYDLINRPNIPRDVADLTDNSGLLVHFSGNYNDLTNKPAIPTDVSQLADAFNIIASNDWNTLANKPVVPTDVSQLTDTNGLLVHFSGSYTDLTNLPSIPQALTDLGIADGQSGQVLVTDGQGHFFFANQAGAGGGVGVTAMDFNEANGILRLDFADGSNMSTPFDGRYLRSINGITGDANGNANLTFNRVIVGPDSLRLGMAMTEEVVFVVAGNINDPTQNGKAYVWDKENATWYQIGGGATAELDNRYVLRENDTLDALLDVNFTSVPTAGQALVWDATSGYWEAKDINAGQVAAEYMTTYLADDQQMVSVGQDLKNTHVVDNEGNITYDPTTGVYIVGTKGTYELSAELAFHTFQNDSTWLQIAWVDALTNSELQLGATSMVFGETFPNKMTSDTRVHCIIKLEAGAQFKLRCNNGTGTATYRSVYSKTSVRKIAGWLPVAGSGSGGGVAPIPAISLDQLTDVTSSLATDGQVLTWDAVNTTWAPTTIVHPAPGSINEQTDVDTTTVAPTVGQALVWDGVNWVPGTVSGGTGGGSSNVASINDLTDVDTLSVVPSSGQFLLWNGTKWVPGSAATTLAQLTDTNVTGVTTGQLLSWNGTAWVPMTLNRTLDGLTDVNASSPINGQSIRFDSGSSTWVTYTPVSNINDLADVDTTAGVLSGQVLTWDGSKWTASTLPPDQYVESAQFNVANGQLTLGMKDSTQVTTTLDGRYARTVNAIQPDALGNIAISLAAVTTGDLASRPATASDATFYVVSGDANPDNDGLSYIYSASDSTWYAVGGVDTAAMDARYVNQGIDTLDALADVDTTTVSPINGNILSFQAGVWVPSTFTVDNLTDVDTTTNAPALYDTLVWDGNNWVPGRPASALDDLSDVDVTTNAPADQDALIWDAASSQWIPGTQAKAVADLTDVDVTTNAPVDNDVLTWDNSNSQWVPASVPRTIDDLSDVDVTTAAPTDKQALVWSNTLHQWVPGTVGGTNSLGTDKFTATANQTSFTLSQVPVGGVVMHRNGVKVPADAVTLAGNVVTYDLSFNGLELINANDRIEVSYVYSTVLPPVSQTLNVFIDVDTATVPPAIGDSMVWDGTNWVPSSAIPVTPVVEPKVLLPDHGRAWGVFFAYGDQLIGGGSIWDGRSLGGGRDSENTIAAYPIDDTYPYSGWKKLAVTIPTAYALSNEGILYVLGTVQDAQGADLPPNYYSAFTPIPWFVNNGWTVIDFWVPKSNWYDDVAYDTTVYVTATKGTETKSFAFGRNNYTGFGILGIGNTTNTGGAMTPVTPNNLLAGEWFTHVDCGATGTLAVTNLGRVLGCGENWGNVLGTAPSGTTGGNNTGNVFLPSLKHVGGTAFTNAVKCAVGFYVGYLHCSIVLDADGRIWTAGHIGTTDAQTGTGQTAVNGHRFWDITPAGYTFVDVIAASADLYALDNQGNVWSWGRNRDLRFGDGTAIDVVQATPKIIQTGVASLKSNYGKDMNTSIRALSAITTDGKLLVWGQNSAHNYALGVGKNSANVNATICKMPFNTANEKIVDVMPIGQSTDADDAHKGQIIVTDKNRVLVVGRGGSVPIPSITFGSGSTLNVFTEIFTPQTGLRTL